MNRVTPERRDGEMQRQILAEGRGRCLSVRRSGWASSDRGGLTPDGLNQQDHAHPISRIAPIAPTLPPLKKAARIRHAPVLMTNIQKPTFMVSPPQ